MNKILLYNVEYEIIKNYLIAEKIMNELSRSATAPKSRGLYRDVEREVLMAVVPLKELRTQTNLIKETDPDTFVIINNEHEVMREGFRRKI